MRALAVEDDARILRDLSAALAAAGFRVETCRDGEEAWFLGDTEEYDLIVLDLGLPRMDGLAVLKRWRAGGRETPVLVLTARGAWTERVEGIDAGADDYLPKPFHMEELVARAPGLVRRAAGRGGSLLTAGDLAIDVNRMVASLRGVPLTLSPLEYRLLAYLAMHQARVVPATELLFTSTALKSVIREGAAHKIESMLQAGKAEGMHRMDDSLFRLASQGTVSGEEAYRKASDKARFVRFVEGM